MNTIRLFASILSCVALSTISACGGGGGDGATLTPPIEPPTGGIGRNGIAVGPVSNFGSIIVNGVEYNTDSATFEINDDSGSQADLRVGDVVIVSGTIDDNGTTGTADAVTFDDLVTGPVASIDRTTDLIEVLGQTVRVTPDTSFDDSFIPASLDGVSIGQIVEVSGQIDANRDIVATRIEPKPAGTQFEVHGNVSSLDSVNMRFNLKGLVVEYSSAMLEDFPGGSINDGDLVEVKGTSIGAAGELIATRVELESFLLSANDGDRLEIEGFITRFVSATDFDVAGFPVTTTGSTVFEGGGAGDLGLNIKVEAEGDIDSTGTLVATKIDIRRAKAVRVTANVDSVAAADNSLVVLGITVVVDALTRIEDKSDAKVDPLTLSDINAGDYVEIRGDEVPPDSGNILATILEREDSDTIAVLQGFVETVNNPSFTILGVTIETGSGTIFRDRNEATISSTEFFSRVTENSLVKVKGVEVSNATITATEVEFEAES